VTGTVHLIDTGVANVASLIAALERLGRTPVLTRDPAVADAPEPLVLPGVGAFGAGMARLVETGFVGPLAARLARDAPTLAVCLGLQLLCESSEETPGVVGLGAVPGHVVRFPSTVRVPQFGWNRVTPAAPGGMLEAGYAYFANSFCLREAPAGWAVAWTDHAGPFVAALERGRVLACQFHPELSSAYGAGLLGRWLGRAAC
jgi:imidazole glycerol phosphate synthase glutamine amidotransferase subunit